MSEAIIQGKKLSRWYGVVMGLNNIDFEILPGITGLVGPNGAGKSTLIQIITGQLQPSSGMLTVFGDEPWNHPAVLKRIGYCPERESLPEHLKPMDWLRGLGQISGISGHAFPELGVRLLKRVKLGEQHWKKRMGQYSKGMRQRVKLAQALMHSPDLLILDEPMNGLDPMGRQDIADILKGLAKEGVSIVISSHILAELESLCKNILILNWGRVIASGAKSEIRSDLSQWAEELCVRCEDPHKLASILFQEGHLLGFDIQEEEKKLEFRIKDPGQFYQRWNVLLQSSNLTIYEISSKSQSLHQIFNKVTTS
ncbi:MAG: ABC transporter ATP-binding protein [Verrucomicrobia bacterium]|jgi:ABC-2 type transport system ATP-binding protein|nr:ABC transporter ATP-binding protein [Verrucomicrobiota bacterium]